MQTGRDDINVMNDNMQNHTTQTMHCLAFACMLGMIYIHLTNSVSQEEVLHHTQLDKYIFGLRKSHGHMTQVPPSAHV